MLAVEYERGLYTPHGFVANDASLVLSHPLNHRPDGSKHFYDEGTLHQLEWKSSPTDSIENLRRELMESEELLQKILNNERYCLPVSEYGAGRGVLNPAPSARDAGYKAIFGGKMDRMLSAFSGIHYHIDIIKGREAEQYNALLALQPSIAFASTSPVSAERINGVNCHRYQSLYGPQSIFSKVLPEEIGYVDSLPELVQRNLMRYKRWEERFTHNCGQHGLSPDYFHSNFTVERTGYPDIRHRPDMGRGTFELRIYDTTPADVLLGCAALLKGYMIQLQEHTPVFIAPQEKMHGFTKQEILLPGEKTLSALTNAAINEGLADPAVGEYLGELLQFSRAALPAKEQKFLQPLESMLHSGENIASRLLSRLNAQGKKHHYSVKEVANANLQVWELQQEAFRRLGG